MHDNEEFIKYILIDKRQRQALKGELLREEFIELLSKLLDVYKDRLHIAENKINGVFEVIV